MSENIKINFVKIVETIKKEVSILSKEIIEEAKAGDAFYLEIYKNVKNCEIFVDNEQSFIKSRNIKDNGIYVVVKFGSASTNFGSSICPITLNILGTENAIKPAQMFFSAFCARWNLQTLVDDNTSNQIWVTPSDVFNFNVVNNGFRTLFSVSGTLILGRSTVRLGSLRYVFGPGENDYEDIDFISFQDNFSNSLAPQPFGNTCGFTKSEANFSTYSFSISTYLLNTQLVADCMAVKGFRKRLNGQYTSTKKPNDKFELYLTFTNGFTNFFEEESKDESDPVKGNDFFKYFKCSSVSISEKIGEIPTISLGFTH